MRSLDNGLPIVFATPHDCPGRDCPTCAEDGRKQHDATMAAYLPRQ